MSLYMKYIYPKIVNKILNHQELKDYRTEKLSVIKEKDKVLEVGFGDGQNLNFYPKSIKQLDAIDINDIYKPKNNDIKVN